MELYKETISTVEFEAPNPTVNVTADYVYNDGNVTPIVPAKSPTEPTIWTIETPYLPDEGTLGINWKFTLAGTQYVKTHTYTVVTPYLTTREVNAVALTERPEDAQTLEAVVRHLINAHCGQSFGKRDDTLIVKGTGAGALALPERLITFKSLRRELAGYDLYNVETYGDSPEYFLGRGTFVLTGDGWFIKAYNRSVGGGSIKSDTLSVNGVIFNPYITGNTYYADDINYEVTGTWGWEEVPRPVVEAARILAADYSSMEQLYRDRYLTSMTAADWRIQLNTGAFRETGNVRADQLLAPYIMRRGWGVI